MNYLSPAGMILSLTPNGLIPQLELRTNINTSINMVKHLLFMGWVNPQDQLPLSELEEVL